MKPAEVLEVAATHEVDVYCRPERTAPTAPGLRAGDLDGADGTLRVAPPWHALWTRSHCERLVWDELTAKGFDAFLPMLDIWSRRAGIRHRIQVPMFPSYLFLRHALDKASYTEVRKTRGLVSILGERWDSLAVVPTCEIEAIQRVVQTRPTVLPYAYLRTGQRVRIIRGPFTDVEGFLVQQKPDKGLLVLSIELLRRSVAIEVDCTWAVPA